VSGGNHLVSRLAGLPQSLTQHRPVSWRKRPEVSISMSTSTPPHDTTSGTPLSTGRIALSLVAILRGLGVLLFVPAGR